MTTIKHESYCNLGPVEAPASHPDCNCKDPLKGLNKPPTRICSDEYLREFCAGGLEQDHSSDSSKGAK